MSTPHGEDTATLVIPTETDPPAEVVDAWVSATLRALPAPERLRTGLVVHELLADGGSAPYVVRLDLVDRQRTLVVSVDTTAGPDDPCSSPLLVAALSRRWGVERRRRARTTWAELDLDAGRVLLYPPRQPRPGSAHGRTW